MPAFDTQLLRREDVAEGTAAFHFARPEGFEFKAGQSMSVTLVDPPETDAKGNTRTFSIASAPFEATIEIATRLRDTAFKRVLAALPPDSPLRLRGPGGKFTLDEGDMRPAVFLAGGIGTTPFVSMLRQAAHDRWDRELKLFFANRRPEDAPFLTELEGLQERNPRFRLIATMTDLEKSARPWSGERGMIDRALLSRHLDHLAEPVYYLAGPPAMVDALQKMLVAAGVRPAAIRTDQFFGY